MMNYKNDIMKILTKKILMKKILMKKIKKNPNITTKKIFIIILYIYKNGYKYYQKNKEKI